MGNKQELHKCYDTIAKYNNLVDLGGNEWEHTPTGLIYVLTPFGFQLKCNNILRKNIGKKETRWRD